MKPLKLCPVSFYIITQAAFGDPAKDAPGLKAEIVKVRKAFRRKEAVRL